MSLAAFIGGRATGPRLNRHAPQQDAHDPTQFEQRTIAAPHPVFGRGGVALPGLAAKGRKLVEAESPASKPKMPSPHSVAKETPRVSPPHEGPIVKTRLKDVENRRPTSPEKRSSTPSNDWLASRQRTMSTPTPPPKVVSPAQVKEVSIPKPSPRPTSYNSVAGDYISSKSTSNTGRQTPSSYTPQAMPSRTNSVSPLPKIPSYQPSPPFSSPKSPNTNNFGLAKPIQPSPRKSLQGPQVPLGQNPSSAFLKPPPSKDPTPSISRLQGRGFVANMVKATSQLGEVSKGSAPPSNSSTPEKLRDTSRKTSVLDRWQVNTNSPPIIAPKPVPLRKTRTMDPSSPLSTSPVPTAFSPSAAEALKRDTPEKTLKPRASLPSIAQATIPDKVPRPTSAKSEFSQSTSTSQKRALGSSTTMISYIKPLKTGDSPPMDAPPSRPSSRSSRSRPKTPDVDEFGSRRRSQSQSRPKSAIGIVEDRSSGLPAGATGGKPLSHVRSIW